MGIILQATELIYTTMEIVMIMMMLLSAGNCASFLADTEQHDVPQDGDHVSASSQFTPAVVSASPSQQVYAQSLSSVPVVGHPTSPVLFSLPVIGSSSFYNQKPVQSPTLAPDDKVRKAYNAYSQQFLSSSSLGADGLPNSETLESRGNLIEICAFFFSQCFESGNELGCSLFEKFC